MVTYFIKGINNAELLLLYNANAACKAVHDENKYYKTILYFFTDGVVSKVRLLFLVHQNSGAMMPE